MRRNIFIGLGLVIILIGAVVYFFFLGGRDLLLNRNNTEQETTTKVVEPQLIINKSIVGPTLSNGKDGLWYFDPDGNLFTSKLDGTAEVSYGLTDTTAIEHVYWPIIGNDFMVKSAQEGTAKFRVYNSLGSEFVDLPDNMQSPAWLLDGKQLAYVWLYADGRKDLKTSDADGGNFKKIADIFGNYKIIASPKENFVLLLKSYLDNEANKIFRVDLDTGKFSDLADRGRNLDAVFSPDGTKLLFSRIDEETGSPALWLYNFSDLSFKELGLATNVNKVVWSKDSAKFYYALPKVVPVDDKYIENPSIDALGWYDLATDSKQIIRDSGEASTYDFRDMFLSDDEFILFFRNGNDGKLYRLNLE